MCDEEVPQFYFPMVGSDRHPAGGALGVDGWVWPSAQHAVSTLFSLLGVTRFHWNVQMPVKIMINPDFGTWCFCSHVCCKGWWSNGTPTTRTVLTWGGRKVCSPSAVTPTDRGFARKSYNTHAAWGHSGSVEKNAFSCFYLRNRHVKHVSKQHAHASVQEDIYNFEIYFESNF